MRIFFGLKFIGALFSVVLFGGIIFCLTPQAHALNSSLPGDVNNDNQVDSTDLNLLLSNWKTTYAAADFNGNGIVDAVDMSIILSHFGQSTGGGGTGGGGNGQPGTFTNWPCSGCIVHVPSTYNLANPTVLLVALHGDQDYPDYIESVWQPATDKVNAIIFTPLCPENEGCLFSDGQGNLAHSWWGWIEFSTYDDNWIENQVATIAASYNIDKQREYLTGWSGGADFLGYYSIVHSDVFAAVAFVAGGTPYVQSCPANNMAAYFLEGSADTYRYTSGQPTQTWQVFNGCGDDAVMNVLPGADHQGTADALTNQDYADIIMNWLLTHTLNGP